MGCVTLRRRSRVAAVLGARRTDETAEAAEHQPDEREQHQRADQGGVDVLARDETGDRAEEGVGALEVCRGERVTIGADGRRIVDEPSRGPQRGRQQPDRQDRSRDPAGPYARLSTARGVAARPGGNDPGQQAADEHQREGQHGGRVPQRR